MSGPKYVEYRIAEERRALDAARIRWAGTIARAGALSSRCRASGHPECCVEPDDRHLNTSTGVNAACDELTRHLDAAARELENKLLLDRSVQTTRDLQAAMDSLAIREEAIAAATVAANSLDRGSHVNDEVADRVRLKIERALSALIEPSGELDELASEALKCVVHDLDRASMLTEALRARTEKANSVTRARVAQSDRLAALTAEADMLIDPSGVAMAISVATRKLEQGADVTAAVDHAKAMLIAQRAREQPERDRRYVLDRLRDTFEGIGYKVFDVSVETAGSITMRTPRDHSRGVAIGLCGDGEVDLRTVRFEDDGLREADRAAEEELCTALPGILARLRSSGVDTQVTRQIPAGLAIPRLVAKTPRVVPTDANAEKPRHKTNTRERVAE